MNIINETSTWILYCIETSVTIPHRLVVDGRNVKEIASLAPLLSPYFYIVQFEQGTNESYNKIISIICMYITYKGRMMD